MMQMQENNEGVQKMTNSLYYAVVKRMNKDIVSISGCMHVTSPLSDSEAEDSPCQRNNHQFTKNRLAQNGNLEEEKREDQK